MDKLPPLPNPVKQKQGKQNRAEGKAFEDRLDAAFAYYADNGYALIDKTPEPFKIIKRLEHLRFIGCFQKKAQPDYKGTVRGGRTVIFEAKFTTTDRITQDRVREQQWSYMEKASKLGARCYVIVGFQSGRAYKVPWAVWREMKEHLGHKYATEEELDYYRVPVAWDGRLQILAENERSKSQ